MRRRLSKSILLFYQPMPTWRLLDLLLTWRSNSSLFLFINFNFLNFRHTVMKAVIGENMRTTSIKIPYKWFDSDAVWFNDAFLRAILKCFSVSNFFRNNCIFTVEELQLITNTTFSCFYNLLPRNCSAFLNISWKGNISNKSLLSFCNYNI